MREKEKPSIQHKEKDKSNSIMKVTVKTLKGEKFVIEIDTSFTIEMVKGIIVGDFEV